MHTFPFPRTPSLDLEPEYLRLQRDEPVCRVRFPYGEPAWLVTRHADARTVLADPRFSRAESLRRDVPRVTEVNFAGGIVAMDPPEHTRLRATCRHAFTARTVARLRERATALAIELVDAAAAGGTFDAVADLAVPYTLRMICALLGVPYADSDRFRGWAEAGLATTAITEAERLDATGRMWEYIADLVARRRAEPAADLISAMLAAGEHGVGDEELVIIVMTALVAGYETTSTQLPNFLYLLLSQRDRWAELVARPELVTTAVEELLRFAPLEANGASPRYARVDVELSGTRIPAGAPVVVATVAANRDPRAFADPHRLDLTRDPNPHLGFGLGAHFCLGAPLARLELRVALDVLVATLPELRLGAQGPRWKTGMLVRGPATLPLEAGRRHDVT